MAEVININDFATASFIAAARSDLPAALDAIDALEARNAKLERTIAQMKGTNRAAMLLGSAGGYAKQNEALRSAIDAVLALHREDERSAGWCEDCATSWPCPTARALGVSE